MSVHVDISDVLRGLDALRARGQDLSPVFRGVRELLKKDVEQHFDRNEGPDGAWEPRAASTIERARQRKRFVRKRGARKGELTKRGARWATRQLGRFRFPNAYRFDVGRQHLEMRARGKWAGIHQFGGTAGKGARIPERTFLWASDTLVEKFATVLQHHVMGAW